MSRGLSGSVAFLLCLVPEAEEQSLWSGLSHKNSEMVWAAIIAQKSRAKK